jgi:LPS-assembly protein
MNLRPILSSLLALAFTLPLAAQNRFKFIPGPKPGGGEVKWTAQKQEVQKDEYAILEGQVTLEYQDIKLQAEKVTYNLKTKDVVAEGNVIIDQGPTRVSATRAVYNLGTKTGTFFSATATMDPQMYFSGDRIEKVDEDTYRLANGVFTSCDLDRPAWSFHIGSADITVDDYARMGNVSFRARRVPIIWLPRLIWPTKRDRAPGFLIPRVTLVSDYGPRFELGYFLPFGDSADATITAELNTERYYAGGLNIRYVPSENVKIGELSGYVVNDAKTIDQTIPGQDPQIQWRYRYQHSQENLPGGFRGVVDIEDFSELDFFRKFDRDSRFHTLSNVYSSAFLTKNRPKYSLNVLADRRELLFLDREQRFLQLPSLQLRMYPQRILGTPLYFSLESSTSRLQTNTIGSTILPDEFSYNRTDVFPTLALQMKTPQWLSLRPQVSVRNTYYSASLDSPQTLSDESLQRFYAQGQVELVGPSFSRTFNRRIRAFTRFKHVIEPRFRYVYTSEVEDQDRIIRFDSVDSPFLPIVPHSVEYSLTQRLLGKESGPGGSAREVLSFALRQTVSLSDPFESRTGATDDEQKFTPLTATLRVNPYQSVTVDANATFSNVTHQLEQTSFSANLVGTGKNADKYLSTTWFATFRDRESSQFRLNIGSGLFSDRIRTDVQLNYDAEQGQFLEQRYILGVTGSCYGIAVGYRQFLVDTKGRFDVAITLKNVGTVGSLR